jgi:hypothetical protein
VTLSTIGTGIGATAIWVPEASYGTVVTTPAWRSVEPTNSIDPKKSKTVKESSPLAGGRLVDIVSRRVIAAQGATVTIPLEVCTTGFNAILNQVSSTLAYGAAGSQTAGTGIYNSGTRVTPTGSIFGYTHTFRNDVAGKSVAWQFGLPTTDAVLRQYDMLGCKPTKLAFSCKKADFLTASIDYDGRVLEDPLLTASYQGYPNGAGQTPYTQATPSYTAQTPLHFAESQIQIGTSAANASSAALIDGVSQFDLTIEHKLNTDRQYMGNAGLKDEQLVSDVYAITGTVTSDFVNKTYWQDAFYSDTGFTIIATWSLGALGGSVAAVQMVLNNVKLNDGNPNAGGKDIVSGSFPFKAYYDLSVEPLTIIVQSTEATV